jgi:hypothetical protein
MNVPVGEELRQICRLIVSEGLLEHEWAARESDDMFQSHAFSGGFDATEMAFCFSYYAPDGSEHWFQMTLAEVQEIAAGAVREVSALPAE